MGDPSTPRFRIRVGDGDELPINSVEALARRVARGDLGPETPLFDASTGTWQAAAEASVVRFILDEMSREGIELPEGWHVPHPENSDPLSLGLTVALEGPEEVPDAAEVSTDPSLSGEPESVVRPREEWLTQYSDGGLQPEVTEVREEVDPVSRPRPEADAGSRFSRLGRTLPRRRVRWGGLAAAIVIVPLTLSWWRGSLGVEGGSEGAAVPSAEARDDVTLPQDLVEVADVVAALAGESYRSAVDSIRSEYDLALGPPQEWLGGNYLANAAGFPQVPEFWARYGDFLDAVHGADGALFDGALSQGLLSSGLPEDERARIEAHLGERHARSAAERAERHAELSAAATAALVLHDFLSERTDEIRYVPAVGNSPAAGDLVLEVATRDAATRRELDLRLDALFQALDRSRGGRAPSPFGLGEDLFAGFSPF